MASTQSTAQSSSTISQLIDQIISTKLDTPDVDLDQLIANIDRFLDLCKANQGKSLKHEKSTVDWLSSTSGAAKISEGISENVNILAKQISEHSTAVSVLRAAGNVHWAGLCLLLVAAVLNRMDTIHKNKMECLDLLSSMNELAKAVRKLKEIPRAKDEMLTQINESIALIVQGAILCCSQKKTKGVKRCEYFEQFVSYQFSPTVFVRNIFNSNYYEISNHMVLFYEHLKAKWSVVHLQI